MQAQEGVAKGAFNTTTDRMGTVGDVRSLTPLAFGDPAGLRVSGGR